MKNYEKRLNSIKSFTSQKDIDELFEEMYSDYSSLIGFVLRSYDLNDDEIKDIINESFFKLFRNRGKVKNVKYFLLACAKNSAINEKKRISRFTSIDGYEEYFFASDSCSDFDTGQKIRKVLDSLDEKEKELFDYYIIQDLSSSEVAKRLHINQNTVRVQWSRTLQKIKEAVKDE